MKKLIAGLCLATALLLSLTTTAEAFGRRRSCANCAPSTGSVQATYHTHNGIICNDANCSVGYAPSISDPRPGTFQRLSTPVTQEPIIVIGNDGRRYYLVPEAQYRQPSSTPQK